MTGAIGERAARAIKSRARPGTVQTELERLNIPQDRFYKWKSGISDPSAYYLQQMVLAGYDIIFILTGKEKLHAED